jgi:hypothetical protein
MPCLQGPVLYAKALSELELEMAKEKGVFREAYSEVKDFKAALKGAGITWKMVQDEYTARSGKGSSTAERNARWTLIALDEEERGVPLRALTRKECTYKEMYIYRQRLALRERSGPPPPKAAPVAAAAKEAEPAAVAAKEVAPAAAAAKEAVPAAVAAKEVAPAAAAAKEAEPAAVAAKEAAAAAAAAKEAAAAAAKKELLIKAAAALAARRMAKAALQAKPPKEPPSSKELAEQALWNEMYEEVSLGGITYLRHRSMGLIFVKGQGVRELGDEMPEWDEDLGEFKAC